MSTTDVRSLIDHFVRGSSGQDLIEYALLTAAIALAVAAATGAVGTALDGWYNAVSGSISTLPTNP